MKLIKIKKSYRNGETTHYMIFEDDDSKDFIEERVLDWAEEHGAGHMYGYKLDWQEEKDLNVLKEEVTSNLDRLYVERSSIVKRIIKYEQLLTELNEKNTEN